MLKRAAMLALLVAPAIGAAGKCDIRGEEPRGSGKAGKPICVNVGDERSCTAMAEMYGSPGWLEAHPAKYSADQTCKNPTDPFAKPQAGARGGAAAPLPKAPPAPVTGK